MVQRVAEPNGPSNVPCQGNRCDQPGKDLLVLDERAREVREGKGREGKGRKRSEREICLLLFLFFCVCLRLPHSLTHHCTLCCFWYKHLTSVATTKNIETQSFAPKVAHEDSLPDSCCSVGLCFSFSRFCFVCVCVFCSGGCVLPRLADSERSGGGMVIVVFFW